MRNVFSWIPASLAPIVALLVALVVALVVPLFASNLAAQTTESPAAAPTRVREIFVPFSDLNVLLEADIERIFLSRKEYESLLARARMAPHEAPPRAAAIVSANYDVRLEEGRALIQGELMIDVLDRGLQALALELKGVGVRGALLDDKAAPLARDPQGQVLVLVEGQGRKRLRLDLVAPLETSAALQSLHAQLPRPAALRYRLTVPGNVEVKSGADVLARQVENGVTQFELSPRPGGEPIVMTLNNRQLLQQRVVLARSVLVDEVTQAYERLHASVSLAILRGAVDRFRFELPDGFDVTEVETPLLSRWAVVEAGGKVDAPAKPDPGPPASGSRVLEVTLREPTTDPVRLNISATRLRPTLEAWKLPAFQPLDVAGHVAVVGLLVDERLRFDSLAPRQLIPIDAVTLNAALPASVFAADATAPRLRAAAAFYAPQSDYGLAARFAPPAAQLHAVSSLLLVVDERRWTLKGSFELRPEVERLFQVDFRLPVGWRLTFVKGPDGNAIASETFPLDANASRVRVPLLPAIGAGESRRISFEAEATPEGWIGAWPEEIREVVFPACSVLGATREEGAVAVHALDDLQLRPGAADKFRQVTPLDAAEKARYGLGDATSDLVYRSEGSDFALSFVATRGEPLITARTFSFLKIEAENLSAHYELVYQIDRASTQRLSFWLPASTPESLVIRGMGEAEVKEYSAELLPANADAPDAPRWRRWTVQLANRVRDRVRLAVDFQQTLPARDLEDHALPLVRADEAAVAYQSGLVSIEGSPELDVEVTVDADGPGRPKKVDVGELAQADYAVGKRLLGAFGYVGDSPDVLVDVFRRPAHAIPSALVQRAELITLVSRSGWTQTAARYQFRSKESFLELRLPPQAGLWSAYLDGAPLAPQRSGESLLLSLPTAPASKLRDVQVVYEAPISAFVFRGRLQMTAPTLQVRSESDEAGDEVQMADLQWQVVLPSGYRLTNSGGTVFPDMTDPLTRRQLALRRSPWADLAAAPLVVAHFAHSLGPIGGYSSNEMMAKSAAPGSERYGYMAPMAKDAEGATLEMSAPADELRADALKQLADSSGPMGGAGGMTSPGAMGFRGGGGMGVPGMAGPGGMPQAAVPPPTVAPPKSEPAAAEQPKADLSIANDPFGVDHDGDKARSRVTRDVAASKAREATKEEKDNLIDLAKTAPATPRPGKPATPTGGTPNDSSSDDEKQSSLSLWALEGVRSLPIEFGEYVVSRRSEVATFRSLGESPVLEAALVNRQQLGGIAWSAAFLLALWGVALTNRSIGEKWRLIVLTLALATAAPLVGVWVHEVATVADHLFWSAIGLTVWYLAVGVARWCGRRQFGSGRIAKWWQARWSATPQPLDVAPATDSAANSATSGTVLSWLMAGGLAVSAALLSSTAAAQEAAPLPKVKVPADAIVVPYNPDDPRGVRNAERILVPLKKYEELWNLAHPGRATLAAEAAKLPAPFAWLGGQYEAVLAGADELTLSGTLDLEVLASGTIDVPLPLAGGVVTNARLDGQPASLRWIGIVAPAAPPVPNQAANQAPAQPPAPAPILALTVRGPGRHQLQLTLGVRLERRGGWRVANGRLPVAPTTTLRLLAPEAKTEVRLGDVFDRGRWETTQANERIETALAAEGILNVQWRPKVAEAEVDQSLTANSRGEIEIREDVVRLVWQFQFDFPRSRRETFSLQLPTEYLVERVLGDNVRGWNVTVDGERQRLDVTLLKAAVDRESIALVASRRGRVGEASLADFPLPSLEVAGAALHQGELTLARSPWLDVRLDESRGLDRIDLPAVRIAEALSAREESPLGAQPFQALKFAPSGYAARVRVSSRSAPPRAELRTLWKIDPREMTWETQLVLRSDQRPIYQAQLVIPEALAIDSVSAPQLYDWAVTKGQSGRVLTAYLAAGIQGELPVVVRGRLPAPPKDAPVPLPQARTLGAASQTGMLIVQVDPSVDAQTVDLKGCESVLLSRAFGWLAADQRPLARLALSLQAPEYSGSLKLVRREPRVAASSVTNIRVTGRSIEETVLVDYRIEEAGIRQVALRLPAWMRRARITAPLLREKRIVDDPSAPERIRVELDLQDEVMGSFRVLVENDRLLTSDTQEAPIPELLTGRTEQRLVALESSGRDEVVFDAGNEVDALTPQQQAWSRLTELFGKSLIAGYQVRVEATAPRLTYRLRDRQVVETVGARIGLAQTQLEVDSNGAYRGRQEYHIDNGTEQFLVVALPPGATLWTAMVAGEPVKPQQVPGGAAGQVRIPLVKTASGDLDYLVEMTYGGKIDRPGAWSKLKFPLMRTVNISVELSRVRLLLPESHRWLRFQGSMGKVDDRGEYEAGFLEYQTKQLSRLSTLLQSGSEDDLGRLRVTNNLKNLGQSLSGISQGKREYLGNSDYSRNLSNFNSVLSKAQEQVQAESAQQQLQLSAEAQTDNRERLNDYFLRQEATRAQGVVGQLGGNFAPSDVQSGERAKGPAPAATNVNPFNAKWIEANGLVQQADESRRKNRVMDPVVAGSKGDAKPGQPADGKAANESKDTLREQLGELQQQQTFSRRGVNRAQTEATELNKRYQQRLELQNGQQAGSGLQRQSVNDAEGEMRQSFDQPARTPATANKTGRQGTPGAQDLPPQGQPQAPGESAPQADWADRGGVDEVLEGQAIDGEASGWSSLTIDLPARGQEYLFLTPRGDIEIEVYAFDSELAVRIAKLLGVLIAALAITGLARWRRK